MTIAKWKIFSILGVAVLLGTGLTSLQQLTAATIPSVTKVADVDVSGLTQEEAETKLTTELASRLDTPVVFSAGGRTWQVARRELGMKLNVSKMTELAMIGTPQPDKPYWVQLILTHEPAILRQYLERIAPEVAKKGKNARLSETGGAITVIPGIPGKRLDIERVISQMLEAPTLDRVELPLAPVPHKVTEQDLAPLTVHVGHFQTRFNRWVRGRSHNLKLASEMVDGVFLRPGEVFSFNEVVGERSAARGYRKAHVFENGQVTDGIGGGMCQISTTLYNMILLSDMPVVERHAHMFPVKYVPTGRDATVNYGTKDFRFRNDTSGALYISMKIEGSTLIADLYGTAPPRREIKIESNRWITPDKIIHARVYRRVYENGKLVSRERISRNTYKPEPKPVKPGAQVKPSANAR